MNFSRWLSYFLHSPEQDNVYVTCGTVTREELQNFRELQKFRGTNRKALNNESSVHVVHSRSMLNTSRKGLQTDLPDNTKSPSKISRIWPPSIIITRKREIQAANWIWNAPSLLGYSCGSPVTLWRLRGVQAGSSLPSTHSLGNVACLAF
jgi:hypothetical protein